jgi:hypothetical protein
MIKYIRINSLDYLTRNIYTRRRRIEPLVMYLIIRCPGCRTFSYVDRYQQWKLCPLCGEAINVRQAPAYLEVEDYSVAEQIIKQLERFLDSTKKKDLSADEIAALRQQYADWIRSRV